MLVTGAGSGIGAATASALATSGYRVIAAVHSRSRATELLERTHRADVSVDVRELDVTDEAAVSATVADVVRTHGALDAVVANAGVNTVNHFERETIADYRRIFDVNVFGAVAVVRAAMPHLRRSGGRVVVVSSIGGMIGLPFQASYCGSKFALEGIFSSVAPVVQRFGVSITLVEPGPVATGLGGGEAVPAILAEGGPFAEQLQAYLANATQASTRMPELPAPQSPDEVAAVIVDVLADPDPPLRRPTSAAAHALLASQLVDVDGRTLLARSGMWLSAD